MPDTQLRLRSKYSAIWTPQIAIHIRILFVLNYTNEKNFKKLKFGLLTWGLNPKIQTSWDFFKVLKNTKPSFLKPTSTALKTIQGTQFRRYNSEWG